MTLERMSVLFSNTQAKNWGDSVHSSVVSPNAYKIFIWTGEQMNYLQSTWKSIRTWVKVNIDIPRTMGLQTCLTSYYNKNTGDVTYLDLSFLILSPVTSCKQDRGIPFNNDKVRWDQNLSWNESQRTIINDWLSEWKGCNMRVPQ